jgi:limonene-1,2-epoxide hydrolase
MGATLRAGARTGRLDGMSTITTSNGAPPRNVQGAEAVVRAFLEALERQDIGAALSLLHPDVVYTNVSLPTVRGRRSVDRLFRPMIGRVNFKVHFDAVATKGDVVLTERIDALVAGPLHLQFWVWGRFEVRDGQITLWRDSFDWMNISVGIARGLIGAVLPAARRRWPS